MKCQGKGCKSQRAEMRYDAYGIPTRPYCDGCYENNYPYRKDKYPTIEHHGYGERLESDSEAKYWNDLITWNERHSDYGEDY